MEKRDEETYNPKIPTGTIELEAREITVLGKVYGQLPFEVMTSKEIREDGPSEISLSGFAERKGAGQHFIPLQGDCLFYAGK